MAFKFVLPEIINLGDGWVVIVNDYVELIYGDEFPFLQNLSLKDIVCKDGFESTYEEYLKAKAEKYGSIMLHSQQWKFDVCNRLRNNRHTGRFS